MSLQPAHSITFSQRLKLLLGPRKMTPWATELRIPSGTMTRMFQGDGIPPTYETLVRIMRTENTSLSWLLGGDCAPFLVSHTIDDAGSAELLQAHVSDSDTWEVVVLGGGDLGAILLHEEGAIEHPNGTIHYTAIELIAGPIGPRTAAVLHQISPRGLATRNVGRPTMRAIYAGKLGTYRLVGDHAGGLVQPGKIYRQDVSPLNLTPGGRLAEIRAEYTATMTQRFTEAWPRLQDSEREIMTRLLEPFLDHVTHRDEKPED